MKFTNHILVIDDNINNFYAIEYLLWEEGYSLTYATNASEALTFLCLVKPDLILLNVMMPEIDRMEIYKHIKYHPNWQHIPFIIVTTLASKDDFAFCLNIGAYDFLSKPKTAIELSARVTYMLQIKRNYKEFELAFNLFQNESNLRENISYKLKHDVCNRLSSIYNFSKALTIDELTNEQKQNLNNIFNYAQKIRLLNADLLVMVQIESGTIKINPCEVDICCLSEEILLDFEAIAEDKKIKIIRDMPQIQKSIFLDIYLFRRLLDNLLSSTINFSPDGSQVKLKIEYPNEEKIQVKISIYDEGPGLKAEIRECIFEKYEVGNNMNYISKIGLYLAFCKMIIAAHGGNIFVESNYPSGSIITLEIENLTKKL